MDTVMLRSGRVDCILGSNVVGSDGKITGYTGVTSNQNGSAKYKDSPWSTFSATITTTAGNGSATITIKGSNDGTNWVNTALGTITITNQASGYTDGFAIVSPWKYVRAELTGIAGTNAAVYVLMGI